MAYHKSHPLGILGSTVLLVVGWYLFFWVINLLMTRTGGLTLVPAIGVVLIPSVLMVATTVGWLERFWPLRGRLMKAVGYLFWFLPPVKHSCGMLKEWHDGTIESPHFKEYSSSLNESERKEFAEKHPFSQWMVAEIVRRYENNVQGVAYLGAAFLILIIGLRGIQVIDRSYSWLIVLALETEFTIIGLLGLLLFYKPEESAKIKIEPFAGLDPGVFSDLTREVKATRSELASEKTLVVHVKNTTETK